MEDITGIRIRKSSFRFGIRHKYIPELKFKKVEKTIGETILESIRSMGKPKEKVVLEGEGAPKALGDEEKTPKKKPGKPLLGARTSGRIAGGFFLLVLLAATAIVYFQSMVIPSPVVLNPQVQASLSAQVLSHDILTASEEGHWRQPYHTAFLRLAAEADGIEELPVTIDVYERPVPSSVYVLRTHRYQAESYTQFISTLSANLSKWGIGINEIGIGELDSLPSQSLLIVPSGYIPQEMLTGTNTRITDLLARGATILYIGQPFSRMYSTEGTIIPGTPGFLSPLAVPFNEGERLSSAQGFNLKSPLYAVGDSRVMGSCSAVYFGSGTIVFLPQTLDGGWVSGELAADDVQRLILEMPWLSPIGTDSELLSFENRSAAMEFFTSSFLGNNVYVNAWGYDNATGRGFREVAYLRKSTRGEIYTQGHSVLPSALGPTQMDVFVELKEQGGEERLFLSITQFNAEVDRKALSTVKLALNSDATIPFSFSLDPGDYILSVVDGDGRSYARAYMRAGDLSVVQGATNFQHDIYEFRFYADGRPIALTGLVYLDGYSTPTTFEDAQSVVVEAVPIVGASLNAEEEHTFTFEIEDYSTTLSVYKRGTSSILTSPFFLGAIGIAALTLGVGFLFARKGVAMYGLDIPDFPPQTTTKIPMKKEALISIFKKINDRYKWESTPLKLSEVKGGFRDILHEGKPVFISDYNLEYLLSRMIGMGLVKRELNYYGVASWEEGTGRSIRYLASFRKLRDICINNAVPFTQMGKGKDYDSKITVLGQDIFVHLYDDAGRVIPSSLSSLKNGMNIILFEEEAEKSEFYEYLSSGYAGATKLKLEIQGGAAQLKTWDEFAQMIKEMKV